MSSSAAPALTNEKVSAGGTGAGPCLRSHGFFILEPRTLGQGFSEQDSQ